MGLRTLDIVLIVVGIFNAGVLGYLILEWIGEKLRERKWRTRNRKANEGF